MENKRYKKKQDIHLTKEEYLAQLKKYLKRLPKEDYNNAMDYFTEYFEDAGSEGERKKIPALRYGRSCYLPSLQSVLHLSAVLCSLL